jgi:hypothetical protein
MQSTQRRSARSTVGVVKLHFGNSPCPSRNVRHNAHKKSRASIDARPFLTDRVRAPWQPRADFATHERTA